MQHHCSEHSTGFKLKPESNTKLLAFVFSVSVITLRHHVVLTFIHTIQGVSLSGHQSAYSFLLLSLDLSQKVFLRLWPQCLEPPAFFSQTIQDVSLSGHQSAYSFLLLSLDLSQKVLIRLWPHCLEPAAFFFKKEPENSGL